MPSATTRELMETWQLTPDGAPMDHRAELWPVRTHDHRTAVLKVAAPTGWHAGAIPALKQWKGIDTVEVMRAAPARGAVLLERLAPLDLGVDHLTMLAQLWRELHRPAHPSVPPLADVLGARLDELEAAGRAVPLPPRLVQQAVENGRRLLAGGPAPVLLHGALTPEHLVERRGELVAISPLGLTGDPHAEAFAVLRAAVGPGATSWLVQDAFWELVDALAAAGVRVEEQRLRDWTVVGAVVAAAGLGPEDREERTALLTLAKAVGAIQVTEA